MKIQWQCLTKMSWYPQIVCYRWTLQQNVSVPPYNRLLKISNTGLRILLWIKVLFLPENSDFLQKDADISKIKKALVIKGVLVVCFGALWDNVWSEPKKLTPIFYYFVTKKAEMKINPPKLLFSINLFC